MSLYQKVRPTSFDEVAGNDETVKSLQALTAQEDPPQAILLTGPSGCGKTTLGRIIALALGVNQEDVLSQTGDYREIDSADFRGIDTMREIRRSVGYMALHGTRRCWLIDECHKMTNDAQNSILKGLEDPPAHAFFVLCTTAPESLLETIRSRCSIHRVDPLSEQHMVGLLHKIAAKEGVRLPRPLLKAIYEKAAGKPRAAIQLLEKVLVADPDSRAAVVAAHEAVKEKADNLARELLAHTGWKAVATILSGIEDDDVESVRRSVIGYCSKVLLNGENDYAMRVLDQMIDPFFQSGRAGMIHAAYLILFKD